MYCYKVFPNNRISCLQAVLSAMTAQGTSCRPDFEILTETACTHKNVQPYRSTLNVKDIPTPYYNDGISVISIYDFLLIEKRLEN